MTRNGDAGVIIDDSDRNQVIGIVAHQQSDGGVVLNNAHDTVVRDNDLRFNPSGVEASNTNNLVVEDNDASESLADRLRDRQRRQHPSSANNVANRTGGAGISLEGGAFDALGNAGRRRPDRGQHDQRERRDGITVADGGHTIRDNTAHNNAGFGIVAGEVPDPGEPPEPGANIDGGGNVAAATPSPSSASASSATRRRAAAQPAGHDGARDDDPRGPDEPDRQHVGDVHVHRDRRPGRRPADGAGLRVPPRPAARSRRRSRRSPTSSRPTRASRRTSPSRPRAKAGPSASARSTTTASSQGMHHFEVRAMDQADNFDLTPATYDWEIDVTVVEEGDGAGLGRRRTPASRPRRAARRPATTATFRFAGSDNATPGAEPHLRVLARRRAVRDLHRRPITYAGLGAGSAHLRGAGDRPRADAQHRPDARRRTPGDRRCRRPTRRAPETTIDSGPDPITVLTERDLHLLQRRPGGDLRVLARRRRDVRGLRLADSPHRACRSARASSRSARVDAAGNADRRRRSTPGRSAPRPSRPPSSAAR